MKAREFQEKYQIEDDEMELIQAVLKITNGKIVNVEDKKTNQV